MKRLAVLGAGFVLAAALAAGPGRALATVPPEGDPNGSVPVVTSTTAPPDTVVNGEADGGAPVSAPTAGPSAPLIVVPTGCPAPPTAAIVFVGTMLLKDYRTARFRVEQVRAGNGDEYVSSNLIDIRYDDDVRFLQKGERYLVGAAPQGPKLVLSSKVRQIDPLFAGNSVIGLTEKNVTCPTIEDPVRTLHVDGTDIDAGVLTGLHGAGRRILLSFLEPFGIAVGIILALALLRWLFTAIFVSVRKAAHAEPILVRHTEVRRQIR